MAVAVLVVVVVVVVVAAVVAAVAAAAAVVVAVSVVLVVVAAAAVVVLSRSRHIAGRNVRYTFTYLLCSTTLDGKSEEKREGGGERERGRRSSTQTSTSRVEPSHRSEFNILDGKPGQRGDGKDRGEGTGRQQ